MRRALGLRRSWRQKVAPFVLLGIVTIPAIVNVGIGYVTRDQLVPGPHRDHHLPRLRRRVVGAAAVRRARRSRRHVPRPAPARPAADVRPPADRRRLRGGQGRRDRHDPVRVLVPARRSCCSSATCSSATARSTTSPTTSTCSGRCRSRSPLLAALLRGHRRRDRVAHRSPHRRRRRGHRAVPRHVDRVGDHRRRGLRATTAARPPRCINVLALPLYLRDLVFLGHIDPDSPLAGVDNGGLLAVVVYAVVLLVGLGRAAAPLPLGGALMPQRSDLAAPTDRPGVRRRRRPSRSTTCRCGSGRRSRCPS